VKRNQVTNTWSREDLAARAREFHQDRKLREAQS
jgi:hypothetical protein